MLGVEAILRHQCRRRATLAEQVLAVDEFDGGGDGAGEQAGHGLAETAGHVVLLGHDDGLGLRGGGEDGFLVQRLDGGHVDDLGADAFGLEGLGGLEGLPHEVAAGDDGDVLALVEDLGLADHELLVLRGEVRDARTAEAQVHGTHVLRGGDGGVLGLVEVAGVDHDHLREGAHEGHVLHGLVRGAVLAEGDARVGGEMLQTLHDIIYRKVDTASDNSMKPNIDGIEHWDYALRQDMAVGKEVLKSPYMMLAGERYLMYNFLKMLYSGSQDATKFAMMFYLYLLIKSRHRREFIQTNGLIGLSNYQQYEDADRNDQLNGLSEAKRRYGVQTALGKMRNNYLEARVGMRYKNASDDKKKKSSEANLGKEQEDKPLAEIRIEQPMFGAEKWKREPLLRQVRLVVTFSKEKYKWKHRLTYIAGIKKEFDIIIKRTQRNKRLKKKDFSVVGIDFSSSDEYARPEVYAQLVRYARKKQFNHFTYHAGEDFYDLMDGLRTIEDILVFLKWDRHCRLGHVIALGVNAERYYKDRGRNVIVTRQTLLDNLVWFLGMQTRYRFPLTRSVRNILVEKIRELYGEIGYSVPFDLDKYQKSMKLRGDFPLKGIKGEGMATFVNCSLGEGRTLDSLRRNADVKTLFDEYIGNEDIHKKGEEIIHWKMPVGIEDGLRRIQEALLDVIGKKKIAIESCPTSNYMIGPFERYDELPLHIFQNRLTQNNISINTDDKGIIATSIEGEYALIAAAMAKGGIADAVIRTKLDRAIEGAKKSRFSI